MADAEADPDGIDAGDDGGRLDDAGLYWFGELSGHGLTSGQAAVLASLPGVDRHRVREALLAAKRRGTLVDDADFIFDAFS